MKSLDEKTKLELLEEMPDKVKLKFPSIEVPIYVSQRYFKKIKNCGKYRIKKQGEVLFN